MTTTTTINPRLTEINNKAIMPADNQNISDITSTVLDRDWVKSAFLLPDRDLADPTDVINRYWSTADIKFTDSRLGCNIGINPRPQFTPYSDIRVKGRLSGRTDVSPTNVSGNYGMGRYYSEAIDDPAQTIYMQFGVPQYNGLLNFLSNAFSGEMSTLARTGRGTGTFYNLAKLAGTAVAFLASPPIALTIMAGKAINSLFVRPTSKFYTLKPTMHTYWSTVQTLVNAIAINKGIFPKILNTEEGIRLGQPFVLDQEYLSMMSSMFPDIFTGSNYFDVYAIANKAQRIANQLFYDDYEALNNETATNYSGYLKKDSAGDGPHPTYISDKKGDPSFSAYINRLLLFGYYQENQPGNSEVRTESDPRLDPNDPNGGQRKDPGFFQDFFKHFDAEFREGSQFVAFKVDHTGPMTESFQNSVVESKISQDLNSVSSQFKDVRFTFAEGNILSNVGGAIGSAVQTAVDAVKDVAVGALSGVTLGFSDLLIGMAGSGYFDIPKHWQSSSASLPRSTYTMTLISPYGNPMSQMINIFIPLSMVLAGTLPLSTGKTTYTSPFICQLFDRGRNQIKLGMIETMTIERGVADLAYNLKGNALAFKVSFSVVDMSSIMHMPVSPGGVFSGINMTLDEDNILSDYLAVLAGMDMYTQIYPMTKAKLTLAKMVASGTRLTSPAYWGSMIHDSATSGSLQWFFQAGNILEGLVRGSDRVGGAILRN